MANDINKKSKRFSIYIYIELISSILFSLFTFSYHPDISLIALPVAIGFTAITVYFCFFRVLLKKDATRIPVILRLTQYIPFVFLFCFVIRRAGKYGVPYWYDVVTVLLWCIVFIFSLVLSHCMNEKRILKITEDWNIPYTKKKKLTGAKWFLFEIVDWIDALAQAVFMVLLVQIFLLQLYVIPSESMVPTFLVKDRVVVTKLDCGPKFPLTDIGLNDFAKYKRGNIVVVRNPHYKIDRKSEIKTVTSQLVYMLTFMAVNLNTDEYGNMKYDPLVKRICGVPGEQLVMQDGVLYRRTKDTDVFEPVQEDAKFACWDLSTLNSSILPKVETFPLAGVQPNKSGSNLSTVVKAASANYQTMLDFEEKRRNYDLESAAFRAKELVRTVKNLSYGQNNKGNFTAPDSINELDLFMNQPYAEMANKIMSSADAISWFENFMTSWISSKDKNRDIYSESNFRLNVMTKMYYGELVARCVHLYRSGSTSDDISNDYAINDILEEVQILDWYIRGLLDSRNMPVFPANNQAGEAQYIPKDCYFMMGDNRFNSLDFRHSAEEFEAALTADDPLSVTYTSQMEPHYVNKRLIIGKPSYRFLPANRRGTIQPR
ncbi:MAG: signal peptidase I [Treponema sp.]|nr:signal peptidase I [Treponema sp.]